MEGFIPYSKHSPPSFLLLNQVHKSLFSLFCMRSASILKLILTPLKFSFQTLFLSLSLSLSLTLSVFLWDGIFSRKSNPTLPLVLNARYVRRRGEARGWFPDRGRHTADRRSCKQEFRNTLQEGLFLELPFSFCFPEAADGNLPVT